MDDQDTLESVLSQLYNDAFVKVYETRYADYLVSKENNDNDLEIVCKEDGRHKLHSLVRQTRLHKNRSFTEKLKRAVASGLNIHFSLLERLEDNQEIEAPPDLFYEGGFLAAKGKTTMLPKIINSQSFIDITTPFFTIGELIEIQKDGYLGYIVGGQVIDHELPYFSWAYDVLPIYFLYRKNCQPEKFLEDELDKVSSRRRPPLKVNFPKLKIGAAIQDKEGFTNIVRVVTKIKWHCHLNIEDYLDEIPKLTPFYSYSLTKWNDREKRLDKSNVKQFLGEQNSNL